MFAFDRETFFGDLEGRTGLDLDTSARAGLEFLLSRFEADPGFTQVRDVAYVLATIRWETGEAFQPVKERRARQDRNPKLWALQNRYWPSGFYGRGYVQITWERNYRAAGEHLSGATVAPGAGQTPISAETFVDQPDLVLDPAVAYAITARGMLQGWFTGRRLSEFIPDGDPPDYVNARRIINGLDQAERIAGYASAFELALRAARTDTQG